MGALDFARVRTEPGAGEDHPFAPPAGWEGDAGAYLALMRERYRHYMHGQRMAAMARFAARAPVSVSGPWSDQAREILDRLAAG
jgi:hypothetical protein